MGGGRLSGRRCDTHEMEVGGIVIYCIQIER